MSASGQPVRYSTRLWTFFDFFFSWASSQKRNDIQPNRRSNIFFQNIKGPRRVQHGTHAGL